VKRLALLPRVGAPLSPLSNLLPGEGGNPSPAGVRICSLLISLGVVPHRVNGRITGRNNKENGPTPMLSRTRERERERARWIFARGKSGNPVPGNNTLLLSCSGAASVFLLSPPLRSGAKKQRSPGRSGMLFINEINLFIIRRVRAAPTIHTVYPISSISLSPSAPSTPNYPSRKQRSLQIATKTKKIICATALARYLLPVLSGVARTSRGLRVDFAPLSRLVTTPRERTIRAPSLWENSPSAPPRPLSAAGIIPRDDVFAAKAIVAEVEGADFHEFPRGNGKH